MHARSRSPLLAPLLAALFALLTTGCDSSSSPALDRGGAAADGSSATDGGGGSDGAGGGDATGTGDGAGGDVGGGTISIYLAGDLKQKVFTDKLASQTPKDYVIALSSYYVQVGLDDKNPVLCFTHNAPFEADMSQDNLVGTCRTKTIPSATYTHGRVKVDYVTFSVDATVHFAGVPYPGKLIFFRAYSNTTYKGKSYKAGEGTITFSGIISVGIPATFDQVPVLPGIKLETVNGEFWMTFPYTRPLTIVQDDLGFHWARFHWEMDQGFRWQESGDAGYKKDVWDVNVTLPTTSEKVLVNGVTGYYITASTDP